MSVGYLLRTPISMHLLDENLRAVAKIGPSDELTLDAQSAVLGELETDLRKFRKIVVEDEMLRDVLKKAGYDTVVEQPSRGGRHLRSNVDSILGLSASSRRAEFKSIAIGQVQRKISVLSSSLDQELMALVYAHDTLAGSTNEITEKLADLVSLYFPELKRLTRSPDKFVGLLQKYPSKEEMLALGEGEVPQEVIAGAGESKGAATPAGTAPVIREYAFTVLTMNSLRERIANRISEIMGVIAPNTSAVAGPLLGAKLIAKAGGLTKLAKLPSSSVQVMGAEKALFRAMKEGGRPPKHGMIFQHPTVHNSPRKLRGKVARALAGKITIASRVDAFSGSDVSEKLEASLRKKLGALSSSGGGTR